ncbi:MAG: phosphoribosylglycinamide formyltransferase [Treponemataceae bacterium]
MKKLNIAVLVSGGGTNLQSLIDTQKKEGINCPYNIVVVISGTKKAFALERAKQAGILTYIASPFEVMGSSIAQNSSIEQKRISTSNRILEICIEHKVDAIVLAGYLSVLTGKILDRYSNRIINLHPSLLPKFGGIGMWGEKVHQEVIASGEKESGCTVHFVDAGCDTGKILLQKKVEVLPNDTPETLYNRIAPEEHKAIVEGVKMLVKMLDNQAK